MANAKVPWQKWHIQNYHCLHACEKEHCLGHRVSYNQSSISMDFMVYTHRSLSNLNFRAWLSHVSSPISSLLSFMLKSNLSLANFFFLNRVRRAHTISCQSSAVRMVTFNEGNKIKAGGRRWLTCSDTKLDSWKLMILKSPFQLKWFYDLLPSRHVISSAGHRETSLWKWHRAP